MARLCPAGTTNAASGTIIGACSDIAPNYELPASTSFPTMNVLDIRLCSLPATYCPGIRFALLLQNATRMAPISATPGNFTSSAMALACPAALSNAASGPSIAACADILPGFALPAVGSYRLVAAVQRCVIGGYWCPGIVGALTPTSPTDMQPYTAVNGSLTSSAVALSCPAGTTNATSGYSLQDCTDIKPGYAMQPGAHTSVSDLAICLAVGSFCPGVVGALDMLSLTTYTTYTAAAGNYTSSATELLCPVETTNVASGTSIVRSPVIAVRPRVLTSARYPPAGCMHRHQPRICDAAWIVVR